MAVTKTGANFPAYDANGNVMAYVRGGACPVRYPFGLQIITGPHSLRQDDLGYSAFGFIPRGEIGAEYEYGPFGELLCATGPLAQAFNHLFSTKYHDWETGLSYYR